MVMRSGAIGGARFDALQHASNKARGPLSSQRQPFDSSKTVAHALLIRVAYSPLGSVVCQLFRCSCRLSMLYPRFRAAARPTAQRGLLGLENYRLLLFQHSLAAAAVAAWLHGAWGRPRTPGNMQEAMSPAAQRPLIPRLGPRGDNETRSREAQTASDPCLEHRGFSSGGPSLVCGQERQSSMRMLVILRQWGKYGPAASRAMASRALCVCDGSARACLIVETPQGWRTKEPVSDSLLSQWYAVSRFAQWFVGMKCRALSEQASRRRLDSFGAAYSPPLPTPRRGTPRRRRLARMATSTMALSVKLSLLGRETLIFGRLVRFSHPTAVRLRRSSRQPRSPGAPGFEAPDASRVVQLHALRATSGRRRGTARGAEGVSGSSSGCPSGNCWASEPRRRCCRRVVRLSSSRVPFCNVRARSQSRSSRSCMPQEASKLPLSMLPSTVERALEASPDPLAVSCKSPRASASHYECLCGSGAGLRAEAEEEGEGAFGARRSRVACFLPRSSTVEACNVDPAVGSPASCPPRPVSSAQLEPMRTGRGSLPFTVPTL
ncbi:hypothetical protein BU16DRAFT_6092 [Lophium mytilinum]|uniref:Uncharacterized protein n=1 Tax=Lophium mytilinum TaxID=390894 RepID=A0A6A6RD89_9PEZI|nr:hypothetical protein BU16DRAFT_6092 [Lophium mytilinum]